MCIIYVFVFIVVQLLSHVQLFVTPLPAAHQVSLSFTNSQSLLKLMFIELVIGLVYAAAAKLCLTL